MELKEFIAATAARTETCLKQLLPLQPGPQAQLLEAINYSLFAGGKRLRPALFFAALDAFPAAVQAKQEVYLPFAAALEMIHTYSLIHDDLPAMDNSEQRRGRPTCHKAFDEATAILAGDALLTEAFAAMLRLKTQVSPNRLLNAMEEAANSAGATGLVAGQMADLALSGQKADQKQLVYLARQKTGALFRACIVCAAHLAGANRQELACLRTYSEQLGLSFQISDDILDVTGDSQKLGKPVGSDAHNSRTTFVSLLGIEQARLQAQAAAQAAVEALAPLGGRAALLRQFPALLLEREH